MNVLLTCAGRRHYLVNYFRRALAGRGHVVAMDASAAAPALQAADRVALAPPVADPDYIDFLVETCRRHEIRLLLSLNDFELPILAAARDQFTQIGTTPVVSRPEVIGTCFDKWKTFQFLRSHGIGTPKTWLRHDDVRRALETGEASFPLVVKPRWGTASILIETVDGHRDLDLVLELGQRRLDRSKLAAASRAAPREAMLIQEWLDGQEFSLDLVNDLAENPVAVFVKKKLAMRAGETDVAEVVDNEAVRQAGQAVAERLGHLGVLDCDAFQSARGVTILELNPRFGGGYPFSHEAGADIPAALIAWANGEHPNASCFLPRVGWTGAKCDILVERQMK